MARNRATKALQKEFKEISENPVEGFRVKLMDDSDLFNWEVVIFGPPKTLYEGGYFKAKLTFPIEYPYSPPTMSFLSRMFHPNIYMNGIVCISILHAPGEDPHSEELPFERWNPTQNVRTILLSVISLLTEPNINSAAHVDASVQYREWKESNGKKSAYEEIVRKLVEQTRSDAERDGVTVPLTVEDYCLPSIAPGKMDEDNLDYLDGDDDYCFDTEDTDDDDDDNENCDYEDEELPDEGHVEESDIDRKFSDYLSTSESAKCVNQEVSRIATVSAAGCSMTATPSGSDSVVQSNPTH